MAANKSCEICFEAQHKYKCPKCYLKYCSVACYKKHSDSPCQSKQKSDEKIQERLTTDSRSQFKIVNGENSRPYELCVTENTVLPERLQRLGCDEGISRCLQNPHLRNLVRQMHDATDPSKALQAAMMEPLFVELADNCLRVVDGKENHT